MGKINIKNVSTATTVLVCDSLRFRRELIPGRAINIDSEVFEELSFEPGVQVLISQGFLRVTGDEETETIVKEVVPVVDKKVLSYDEIKEIFQKKDYIKFAKTIPEASHATKDNMVKCAIENNVTDNAFTNLIKKYCGVDVLKAITLRPAM